MSGKKLSFSDIATACKLRGLVYQQDGNIVTIRQGPVSVTLRPDEHPPDGFELIDALYAINKLAETITANQHLEENNEII